MSERKSWDIAPKPRKPAPSAPAPAELPQGSSSRTTVSRTRMPMDMVRTQRPATSRAIPSASRTPLRPAPRVAPQRSATRVPQRRASTTAVPTGRLRERRKKAQKAARITILIVAVIAMIGSLYALWLPQFRVQEVMASGPNAEAIAAIAEAQLTGTYALVVPKNSILFLPKEPIRTAVLAQFPDIADVDIVRASFTTLDVTVTPRAKAFIWCGTSFTTPYPDGSCFEADGGGLIYRVSGTVVDTGTASSTEPTITATQDGAPISDLRIYSPLDVELAEGQSPVGARVSKAAAMPDVLKLVEAINSLNVPIVAITLRDDEADLWVNESTRLTYVVGRELGAAKLAESVIPTLNLTDGSIQYLDLRFNGKAYLKRNGE